MPTKVVEQFVEALREAEKSGDVESLAVLFSNDAELKSPRHSDSEKGREGARQFWKRYRQAFAEIRSEFHQITETDNKALLEWSSEGQLPDGKRIRYDGVSILETADGQVQHFRTYYDSAAFVQHVT